MPFHYRLQKILQIRIRKKEEQLQKVLKAKSEVDRIELLILKNREEIKTLTKEMRQADPMMYNQYDKFIKHLWLNDEKLQQQKLEAIDELEKEKKILIQREQEVNVLEKDKENKKEYYIQEEKKKELKELNEIGSQRAFINKRNKAQEQEENDIRD